MDDYVRSKLVQYAQKKRQSFYHLARRSEPGEHADYLRSIYAAWADAARELNEGMTDDVEEEDHQTGTTNEGH